MSQPPKPTRPSPPHNPELRELIRDKRSFSSRVDEEDLKQGFRGWHERGYLPHRDESGLTQFVTFHLHDCFPKTLQSEWKHLANIEPDRQRRMEVESYLDQGRGECYLLRPEIAEIVEAHLLESNGKQYDLRAWIIMPNHVHALIKQRDIALSTIIGEWKGVTSRLANKLLERNGAFWAADYFDVFMRNEEHEKKTVRYVENNPTKAKLVLDPKRWPWSSARFRDEFGELRLPHSK